ncbi:hypothetical protein DCCM_3500 [Desulfocucumis palustris]|uniref:DUF3800 domain-containing protein n=1 Tax=Desulfocucumis palustris TaxID=1898651 RepID=A0A2L2XDG6_9FIRM|nr:DUF3800 domain-containing protein [Desulfocucumis palustris]GBF34387.1 hypothetical protein DCCM_3500 [Desulfocucumis palustris]
MLSFVDISGDFGSKPEKEKYIVASAVIIRKRSIGDITRLIHNFKRDILNNVFYEAKANSFINKDTLNNPEKNKYNYIQHVFDYCIDRYDCFYSSVVIKNEDIKPIFSGDRLSKHYIYLMQRIQKVVQRERCESVVVIIDNDNRRIDKGIAHAFNSYLYRTIDGQSLDRILQAPIFGDSEMTVGIQLADFVAGTLKKYYTTGLNVILPDVDEGLYQKKLREFYGIIYSRTPNFPGLPGIYEAPPDFLSKYYV